MAAPTVTAIPTAQQTRRAADKPALVALNALQEASLNTGFDFIANTSDAAFGGADQSSATYPTDNVIDRDRVSLWRFGSSQSTIYLLIDAGTSSGGGATIDADCIVMEGFGSSWLASATDIRVRCSNGLAAGALDGDAVTVITITTPAQDLVAEFWNYQYSARYWEIRLRTAAPITFQASQLWLGQQAQLDYKANAPFDPDEKVSDFETSVTRGGTQQRVSMHHDRRRVRGTWWARTTECQAFLADVYDDTRGWARPFWYFEDPATSPEAGLFVMNQESGIYLPAALGTTDSPDREWSADLYEQVPRGEDAVA